MSAFICDRDHIVYLVQAANTRRLNRYGGKNMTAEEMRAVGQMLWNENVRSVSHRYPNEPTSDLPGPCEEIYTIDESDFDRPLLTVDPVQVLKSCDCYEYQACEHPEWGESEAKRYIDGLRKRAWQSFPGYEDAEWGGPKEKARKVGAA